MMKRLLTTLFVILFGSAIHAETAFTFGDYSVHYSAFTTDFIPAEVAKQYGITRSKNRAMMNISVIKKVMNTSVQPVRAEIVATATNLNKQLRKLAVKEHVESGAIYYISEFPVSNGETLDFNLAVTPEGMADAYEFTFQQQFVTE